MTNGERALFCSFTTTFTLPFRRSSIVPSFSPGTRLTR